MRLWQTSLKPFSHFLSNSGGKKNENKMDLG